MDPESLAEAYGLKVGDQIVQVNGTSFESVTHANAVEMMRTQKQLMLTVRVRNGEWEFWGFIDKKMQK